tara:strand:- start:1829 stop:3241 length:1413 start_codon:yes stop_codon:yes gene_type:complete
LAIEDILKNLKASTGSADSMIQALSGGASNTDLSSLEGGALGSLLDRLVPKREPIDPALLALIGFSELGAKSSVPGATAFGAGSQALNTVAKAYLQDQRDQEKSDLARATTGISLATQLGKPKTEKLYSFTKPTTIDGVTYKKGATKFFTNKELNNLDDTVKANIVTYSAPKGTGEIETYISQFDGNLYHKKGPNKGKRVEDDSGKFINYEKTEQSSIGENEQKVDIFEKKDDAKAKEEVAFAPLNLKQKENFIKVKDKYQSKQFVKDYNDKLGHMDNVFTAYNQVYELDRPGAGDLALIFSFMKMLDPRSVVREGEFEVAKKVGGPADFLVQTANYIKNGGILSDLTRRSFRDLAYAQYKNATNNLTTQNEEEVNVGEVLGLEKKVIETYIKSPKQYTLATDTYKIILPKKTNKQELSKFFLENNYTVDDIEYMLGGENVKDNNSLKRTILDILKDVQNKRIVLKPKVR